MERENLRVSLPFILLALLLSLGGCKAQPTDAAAEVPPPATVTPDFNVAAFSVDHPEQFPLAVAVERDAPSHLVVTGAVNPDVARNVPVISLASGRVVSINARLGDMVRKGQLCSGSEATISRAPSLTIRWQSPTVLARAQWERAQDLYKHGAIALNDFQVAQDAEDKAKVAVDTAAEHLRLLGSSVDHPSGIVDIVAPVTGVITDQQVTNAAGVQALGTSPFTISDLSYVWIVCDVYENDLSTVKVGDSAEITLNAYPGKVLKGTISNISPILDPSIRTAKVRVEVKNPGLMRVGMFVSATFQGRKNEVHTVVPASAILHLHDREYVYVPAPERKFRRVEVVSGPELSGGMQEIVSGIHVGQQVVSNAVVLQHTVEQ